MKNGSLPWKILHAWPAHRLATRADFDQLASYNELGRALARLEAEGFVERVARGVWLRLEKSAPQLEVNRTWSRPSGVDHTVLIANVLVRPTFQDFIAVTLAYGSRQVRSVFDQLIEDGDISSRAVERDRKLFDIMARAFRQTGLKHAKSRKAA